MFTSGETAVVVKRVNGAVRTTKIRYLSALQKISGPIFTLHTYSPRSPQSKRPLYIEHTEQLS
jgi:hypothetical protein